MSKDKGPGLVRLFVPDAAIPVHLRVRPSEEAHLQAVPSYPYTFRSGLSSVRGGSAENIWGARDSRYSRHSARILCQQIRDLLTFASFPTPRSHGETFYRIFRSRYYCEPLMAGAVGVSISAA